MKAIALLMCCFLAEGVAAAGQTEPSSVLNSLDEPGKIYLTGRGTADGRMFEYYIEPDALKDAREWIPDKTDPPLTVPRAVSIAKQTARSDHSRFSDFLPGQIELMPVPSLGAYENQWFYIVSLYPVVEKLPAYQSEITVIILMNGFVVKPKLRDKKERHSESWITTTQPGDSTETETQPAIQSADGKFFLVRRGKDHCAIRLRSAKDQNRAEYDAYYQADGGGNFADSNTVATHGSVYEGGGDSHLYIFCGSFRIQWSAGNWVYWMGFEGLADFQIASTPWTRLEEIHVSDGTLQWHGLSR